MKKDEPIEMMKDIKMSAPKGSGRGRGRKRMVSREVKEQQNEVKRSLFKTEVDTSNDK